MRSSLSARVCVLLLLVTSFAFAACDDSTNITTATSTQSFAGVWTGTASDSSGSALGTGVGSGATSMTWTLTQSGTQVNGTVVFSGLPTAQPVTVTGTVNGNDLSFSVLVPAGTVSSSPNCSASASGTLTLNSPGSAMAGIYAGTSTCNGAFSNGQITLTRR